MTVLLDVKNLETKFFTVDGVVNAVNGISYQVNSGECLAIVGESGCGKSVSVLSLIGLIQTPPGKVTNGEVLYKGQDLLKLSRDELRNIRGREISMVFQDPMTSLNPVMKIGDQITETLIYNRELSKKQAYDRALDLLDRVGIPNASDRIKDYPHQFSGGMRQRVMIAIALASSSDIIIADEPTTALDVTIQAQILDLVKRLQKELETTLIWISHDLGVVAGLADRVNVMYAGFIVESGPVNDLYASPAHPYTQGLLNSVPRLDLGKKKQLQGIDGFPPNLIGKLSGCPFAPRCSYSDDRCQVENPVLALIDKDHEVACWNWIKS
jgi:oligopeptide transport system ATP-binding protein